MRIISFITDPIVPSNIRFYLISRGFNFGQYLHLLGFGIYGLHNTVWMVQSNNIIPPVCSVYDVFMLLHRCNETENRKEFVFIQDLFIFLMKNSWKYYENWKQNIKREENHFWIGFFVIKFVIAVSALFTAECTTPIVLSEAVYFYCFYLEIGKLFC